MRGGCVLDEGAVIGKLEDLSGGGHVLGAAVEAAGIGKAAVSHDVQILLDGRRVVAGNHEYREVGCSFLARSNVVGVESALCAVRAIGFLVLVRAGIIDAADIGIGVAAGNTGACLALDGRRGVNGGTVAKQIAISGVAVGGTHRQRAHGARGHVRACRRGSGIVRTVERDALAGYGELVVVVSERDVGFPVNRSRIGRVNHRRQVARGLAVARLYVHARCKEAVLIISCVNLAQKYALLNPRFVGVAVHEHVYQMELTAPVARNSTVGGSAKRGVGNLCVGDVDDIGPAVNRAK